MVWEMPSKIWINYHLRASKPLYNIFSAIRVLRVRSNSDHTLHTHSLHLLILTSWLTSISKILSTCPFMWFSFLVTLFFLIYGRKFSLVNRLDLGSSGLFSKAVDPPCIWKNDRPSHLPWIYLLLCFIYKQWRWW